MTDYVALQSSSFLDLTSYQSNSAQLPVGSAASGVILNLALVLDRANPVTDLLNADWATRQTEIAALNTSNTLWQTYGADQQDFSDAIAALGSMNSLRPIAWGPVSIFPSSQS